MQGCVTDQHGEPVEGVTVAVRGTNARAVTDGKGQFRIRAAKGQTVVFSCIGYARRELKVSGNRLDVTSQSSARPTGTAQGSDTSPAAKS